MAKKAQKPPAHEVALTAVCNIGRAVAAEMDLPALLDLIYQETTQVMEVDCFAVGLYDPKDDGLRLDLLYDREVQLPSMLLRRSEGWGLVGRVFETQEPLLYSDLAEGKVPEGAITLGDVPPSWLGVPLVARDRAIGVITVQSYQEGAFAEGDQRILEAIASQAAVAVENLFLRREHERRIAELSVLSEIGRAIITSTRLEDLLEVICEQTSRVMDTSNLYIALYDEEEERVYFAYFLQDGERITPPSLHLSDGGLTVRIVETKQAVLIEEDVQEAMENLGITLVGRPAESYLGLPMLAGERVVGVLSVQSPDQRRAYDRRHQDLLSNIANLAAVAIENIRLSEERQQRLAELRILNEIGQALSSAMALEELLERVHEEVSRVFDTTNFFIGTYEEETDEWTLAFCWEHGKPDPRMGNRYKVGAGLTGYIIRGRKPVLLHTMEENVAFQEAQNIQAIGERAHCWMGVPLVAADKIVGVMAIQSYEEENLYTEQDLTLFETIAAQVAVAIDSSRLLGGWQERATDLSVLAEAFQAILEAGSEEELTEAIHRQVGRVMDATNFYVALYDEEKAELDFAYFVEDGQIDSGRSRRPAATGGLTPYIVQNRKPLFLPVYSEELLAELGIAARGRPAKSYLGVPMVAGEQIVGAIAVQSYEREHAYSARHQALLVNIATQAALAMQRIRLEESGARRARQLATIGEVSRKVTAVLDLDELLRELARSIHQGFGYSNVAVFRVEEESREAVLGALVGRYAGIVEWGYRQSIEEGLVGWTAREGKTLLCNNVLEDPRFIRGFDAEGLSRSELCVPIVFAGGVIGVLDIQAEEEGAFDEEDAAAMETLAGQLAAAMRNAILFRERGEQLASLNAINRVIRATAAALSLEDLLTALCDVVVELMTPDGFYVALYEREGGELVAPLLMDEGVLHRDVRFAKKGFSEYMLETGKPLLINNLAEEAAQYPIERTLYASEKPSASWLGVPLHLGEKTIGAIVVASHRVYAFDEQDVEFLQAAASQIVINVEKTRLFDETQRALEELRVASEQQRRLLEMIQELSTPLVPIVEGVLVLPLVGTIDSQRAQQIMDVLLQGIAQERARVVILDITGVPVVDTSVANYLLQATQAVRLLGAECILVGITPEVAQTVVGLGVELAGLITRSDLQGGVEYALGLLGQRIVKPVRRVVRPRGEGEERAARTPEPARPVPSRSGGQGS